ncbi:hypothetical protein [Paraclostridium bifermentans]|uniref:hypothetical protein n=1 Tax=Paraclostridium bifermentans TaxID=1490 RepID=UPI00374EAFDB
MQKRVIKLIATGILVVGVGTTPLIAHAGEVSMEDSSKPSASTDVSAGSVEIVDGAHTDGGANAGSVTGPKITTAKDKFLLEVGQPFNFQQALGLKIVDDTDGDMTSKLKIPDIATDKATTDKPITKTIKAANNKGETSSKVVTVNIIQVAKSAPVSTKEEVQSYDLAKLITGDTSDLTISLASVDPEHHEFTVAITDGVNTINKKVAMAGSDGSVANTTGKDSTDPSKDGTTTDGTTAPGDNATNTDATQQPGENQTTGTADGAPKDTTKGTQGTADSTGGQTGSAIPKTGAVVTGVGGVGVLAGGLAGLKVYMKRRG